MMSRAGLRVARAPKAGLASKAGANGVNGHHAPDVQPNPMIGFVAKDNATPFAVVSKKHWDDKAWAPAAVASNIAAHSMATWGPGNSIKGAPMMVRGEGVYLYDTEGKQYVDLTSQAVCANFGHTTPPAIKAAVAKQMEEMAFVYSGLATCEVRARLSSLLAEVCPGDINGFLFPSGGGEANEAAIRMARRFTGRPKVISHYRSYHGGATGALAATGDFRRWCGEAGAAGFVKAFGPTPWHFSFGRSAEEEADVCLRQLEEQILLEGPHTIAAIMFESIVGSGGVHKHPAHYVQGVRALCDKHGILLILDEVMCGFGRAGPMWGFQHYPGVVPDIMTSAKGLTASVLPMAMVGARQHIKEFFDTTPVGWGATYHAHPVSMACAYASVKYLIDTDLLGHVAKMAPVLEAELSRLVADHPSVARARSFGLFGCLDLVGPSGRPEQRLEGPPAPSAARFKAALKHHGVFGFLRLPLLHVAPPLIITEPELRDATARLSAALKDSLDLDFK